MSGDNRITPPLPDWPRTEAAILSELDYRPLGVELWLMLRKARLWSETPAGRRPGLFNRKLSDEKRARRRSALIGAPELRDALTTMWEMIDRPAQVDDRRLGQACCRVADWAANRGMIQSAVHWSMAGAAIALDDPAATNQAALMFRRASDWKRAEQCYPRAIAIAQRQRNWTEYICGHIGSAALLYTRGVNLSRAVVHLGKAARKAHDKGMLWLAGHALHDSMLLLLEREDYEGAEAEAGRAAALYPLHDQRFPCFVLDYALVQLMQRRHVIAHDLLRLCLEVIDQPSLRGLIFSMLARASAGLGTSTEFSRYEQWALELAEKYKEHAAAALYHLAEAARMCQSWTDAEHRARDAYEMAKEREDREVMRVTARLLREIRARELPPPAPARPLPEELVRELAVRLKRWSPDEHRGRRRTTFRDQWVA